MNRKIGLATLAATLVVFLAGCSSLGGLGGILGGDPNSSSYPTSQSDLYGTVNSVDTRAQRIDLTVNDSNGRRNTTVYYDSRTRVVYQNQQGSPSQLERGDQVDVRLSNNGNGQNVADTITVTQSMSSSSNYPNTYPSSQQSGNIQGVVSYVDTNARRIDVSTSYGNSLRDTQSNFAIYYDSRTRVVYQGRNFSPADLERGDQIDVSTFNSGNNQNVADTITVTRNVRQ